MENLEPDFILITQVSKNHLSNIAKWTYRLSLTGLIFFGLAILIFVISIGYSGFNQNMELYLIPSMAIGFFSTLWGVYALYKLLNFSNLCKKALALNDSLLLELSFQNLKQHFKIVGITVMVFTIFYFAILLFMGIGVGLINKL